MNEELLRDKLNTHETRLNDHSKRLDKIEQSQVEFKIEIKNLCDNLRNLTNTMKWLMGIWVTSLLGFFFYVVQNKIFR
ncbi:hemolysin XhlA [Clostridium tepidiprofundi DSM 19306]|uniref:Hemolysin XhlA n=1 Tax=Clostridium tepidiprofundi DSM 19306 TaxID=1121338 RepID=A0A151B7E9_9CLOT|nr:hemolysin XhlA family protein [Clostridium tepidiprofundi]KYH35819.1 hemolysin XhlA [Clostridium tepidiprofundi DSM 19306]